ncbi:MAG: c-type cytochrome [Brumimicrobium sp.]|nr:c-type cytochrome [Brumimicrobium sp.]MCO5269572.1 c-type cytochrome [Brumimicrobium sp.]
MKTIHKILLISLLFIPFFSCKKNKIEQVEPYKPTPVSIKYPSNFPEMKIPSDNLPTKEAIALGRALYYEKMLSKNQNRSCSSCHDQSKAFTTPTANPLAHINLGWSEQFLWNGKYKTLEDVMLYEVEDFFETDLAVINASEKYKSMFKKAYNVEQISYKNLAYALAQFFRTMNSYNSKYDKWLRGETTFTNDELEGYYIFFSERGDCFHCHGTLLTHDNSMHNNGLDINPDPGMFEATGKPSDYGKFKSPTLRNIELTAPYMHDGRFQTLAEVLMFYSNGVQKDSPNLSPLMKYASNGGVQLDAQEMQYLIAFLKTLTDNDFITNPDLSDPN